MRCVSQQGVPAEAPARQRVAIHERVFIDDLRAPDQRRDVEPVEPPILEVRQHGCLIDAPIPVPRNRWLMAADVDVDRKSTRLNSSHLGISYAVFCLKKKRKQTT